MDWIQINRQLFSSFPGDSPYLVGVSGGRDSVALLHWLIDLGYGKLVVCHLDHPSYTVNRSHHFAIVYHNIARKKYLQYFDRFLVWQ